MDNGEAPTEIEGPPIPVRRLDKFGRGRSSTKEPDSGISSTISSTTRPWSQNDTSIETDQVCFCITVRKINIAIILLLFVY